MDSGEISSIVAIVGLLLTTVGANVDPVVVNGAVQGVFGIVTFGAAIWSWWSHRQKNIAATSHQA